MKPYIQATLKTTEEDLTPDQNWYPKMKRKERRMIIESKANYRTSLPDQVAGVLNPIVWALNKGKNILPQSIEHKMLFELLAKINGSDAITPCHRKYDKNRKNSSKHVPRTAK